MTLRSVPLLVLVLGAYNILLLFGGSSNPSGIFDNALFEISSWRPSAQGTYVNWIFTWGDLIILLSMLILFIEILKATYTSTASLVDHGLSMLVFIACLIEFLLFSGAFTSVFFIVMVAAAIDVIAGYTIGIRVARRDIGFGGTAP